MRTFGAVLAALTLALVGPAIATDEPAPEVEVFKRAGEAEVTAHVFRPRGGRRPAPAVLLFHGGGWVAGGADWVYPAARLFAAEGLVAISVDYRLAGERLTPLAALEDACDAFAWTRANAAELGVDPARVAAYGVSAGGQLATAAALGACADAESGPDLLMLWSPALDVAEDGWFRRLMQGADPSPYSPSLLVASRKPPPTAIVQGEKDALTPLADAQAFCERARAWSAACELFVYPNVGHLLTRNLVDQEDNYDPDPVARADGQARLKAFLRAQGYAGDTASDARP